MKLFETLASFSEAIEILNVIRKTRK